MGVPDSKQGWVVYILECRDGSLYTGITNFLERRLKMHEAGIGAKYMRGRAPFVLRYTENCVDRKAASSREREIKALSRSNKLQILEKRP